ncbi:hypothetical protein SD81_040265 [Tolypothrix campylonemoides VB511288]|nr:hypothetical protein SD81_040265 [Tolypothrix campylonemoides VB511288]
MKPVTYHIQNNQIDQLTEQFGSQLEQLDRPQKLQLRAILTYFVIGRDMMGSEYSINAALIDSNQYLFVSTPEVEKCIEILQNITVPDAESLQVALVEQCRTGNARLKTSTESMTDDLVQHGVDYQLARMAAYILITVDNTRERTSDEQVIINQVHQILIKQGGNNE